MLTAIQRHLNYTHRPLNPVGLFLLNCGLLLIIFLTLKSLTWMEISIESLKDKTYNQPFFWSLILVALFNLSGLTLIIFFSGKPSVHPLSLAPKHSK